jgi:hypothetical protein
VRDWRPNIGLRPVKVLQVALLLLVVANLGRIPVFSTGAREAPILANDIFVLVVLLSAGLAMAHARSAKLDAVAMSGLLWAALGGFSTLVAVGTFSLNGFEVAVSLAYLARWVFYFGLYIAAINVMKAEDATPVWKALEATVLMFAAFGIVQAAFLPDFAQIVYPESRRYVDWDPQKHRLVSTVLDPNFAGAIILSVLMVHIAQLTGGLKLPLWKPLVLIAALLLTASRSSALALVCGGIVVLMIRGVGKRFMKFAAIAVGAIAVATPWLLEFAKQYNKLEIDASALTRLVAWARGLRVFADHPILGVGMNTWGFVQERYGFQRFGAASYAIEGGLFFVAVMTGLVGLAVFIVMLSASLMRARTTWLTPTVPAEHRALAIGSAAFTVALVVHSVFTNSLFLPFIIEPLFVLWALARVTGVPPDPPRG